MPVFFYIDPEFAEDPNMAKVREITLSYTFFESKNFDYQKWSASLPVPSPAPSPAPAAA
jgi:cytochrome c oxidase assembly protein Cox11